MAFNFKTKQEFYEMDYPERAEYFKGAYEYFLNEYKEYKNEKDRKTAISYFYKMKGAEKAALSTERKKSFNYSGARISKNELNELSGDALKMAAKNIEGVNNIIDWANENNYPLSAQYKKICYQLRSIAEKFADVMQLYEDGLVSYARL